MTKVQALHCVNPLDISIDATAFTVGDLHQLLLRYPQDAPVRICLFDSVKPKETPDFFPATRMTFGSIESPVFENEVEEAFVLMFDTGITGEEFDGPHDAYRDHSQKMIEHASTSQTQTKRPKRGRELVVVK